MTYQFTDIEQREIQQRRYEAEIKAKERRLRDSEARLIDTEKSSAMACELGYEDIAADIRVRIPGIKQDILNLHERLNVVYALAGYRRCVECGNWHQNVSRSQYDLCADCDTEIGA